MKKVQIKLPETIAFVGDIHCGSFMGLWPEDLIPGRKNRHVAARYLLKCWQDLLAAWPKKIDALVLMGDLVDGPQRKSEGVGVFTTSMNEQAEGAIEILRPLADRAERIYRVWGTPYHEGFQDCLSTLDAKLEVDHTAQVIDFEIDGKILNAAHHPASGSALYQGTSVDKEVLWAKVAAAENKTHAPRWIVRAHKHFYMRQETEHSTGLQMPCFQLPTAHAIKTNYWRFQPNIGGVLMSRDERSPGGYRFDPTLYEVPKNEVVKI